MRLYEDKTRFRELITETSEELGLLPSIVEKDYYVTCILKRIVESVPFIIFKGGTSLSKCFRVIRRFSEDIDISFGNEKNRATQSQRKDTNRAVRDVCRDNGFGRCLLKDEFRSNREFNSAVIEYDRLSYDVTVENKIIIELSQFLATYPTQQKEAGSYITDYLKKRGDRKTMERFDLFPFSVSVQALERTFVDKVFALCDYYLRGDITWNSRLFGHNCGRFRLRHRF
ncbi:MAG: nucleotidyl transferase AbiEii/AbiGii toxin family protein [Thermoguttaceae bacterium]|nr:nucleotidyl transferase AbiEii/AbiGii toxin family protein [Thermoguttaceae bacterium]